MKYRAVQHNGPVEMTFETDKHPRKMLLHLLHDGWGIKGTVSKMFNTVFNRDNHIGYVIGNHWMELQVLQPGRGWVAWIGNPEKDPLVEAVLEVRERIKKGQHHG